MTVKIYVEGGGDNEDTITRCRQGFSTYCANAAPGRPRPKIIPCGGRDQAKKNYIAAVQRNKFGERYALLVDSEGPVEASNPAAHLSVRDEWEFPKLQNLRIFLMVQATEAWFLADRKALCAYYGDGFRENSLPGSEKNIESIHKDTLEPSLKRASKDTIKGEYHKTKHGFALLTLIDPKKVEDASPHAAKFHQFLRNPNKP